MVSRKDRYDEALQWCIPTYAQARRLKQKYPIEFANLKISSIRRALQRRNATLQHKHHSVESQLPAIHRTVVVGDIHSPYYGDREMSAFTAFVEYTRPDMLVLLGDTLDCYPISRFRKSPDRSLYTLQYEVDVTVDVLKAPVAAAKRTLFVPGNHEKRLYSLMCDNPGLFNLRNLHLRSLFAEAGLEMEFIDFDSSITIGTGDGKCILAHGFKACLHAAWHYVQRVYTNTKFVAAHTHRPEMKRWKTQTGLSECHILGVMCDIAAAGDYAVENAWSHGFGVIDHFDDMKRCNIFPVTIENGKFSVDGKVYGG